MDGKIPLPTDNIYKFYALFGLLLLVTSIAAFVYLHQTTNALLFEALINVEELSSKENPTPVEAKKKEVLKRRIDIAVEDKAAFNKALGALMGLAIVAMSYGFRQWHYVVQPKQDKLLDLQVLQAEQDLKPPPRSPFRAPGR